MGKRANSSSLPITVEVGVHHNGARRGHFKTRSVGFNCIKIASGSLALEIHDLVCVTFTIAGRRFRIKGLYTYQSDVTGTIMFTQYVPPYSEVLTRLLKQHAVGCGPLVERPSPIGGFGKETVPKVPAQASHSARPAAKAA